MYYRNTVSPLLTDSQVTTILLYWPTDHIPFFPPDSDIMFEYNITYFGKSTCLCLDNSKLLHSHQQYHCNLSPFVQLVTILQLATKLSGLQSLKASSLMMTASVLGIVNTCWGQWELAKQTLHHVGWFRKDNIDYTYYFNRIMHFKGSPKTNWIQKSKSWKILIQVPQVWHRCTLWIWHRCTLCKYVDLISI